MHFGNTCGPNAGVEIGKVEEITPDYTNNKVLVVMKIRKEIDHVPVVLKTDEPAVAHKSDAGGVVLGLGDAGAVRGAYTDVAGRLGPRVSVSATAPAGVEVALGLVHDAQLGPLLLVAAGGVLVELLHDRALAVPPLDRPRAHALLGRLRARALLDGVRGAPAADVESVVDAVLALSALAVELGDALAALDVNPLLCGPAGAVAVDALVLPR
jgi:hypothetical protein